MDTHQISAFIDDELALDEKIGFVEAVHGDKAFKDEAVSLLRQELSLRGPVFVRLPEVKRPRPFKAATVQWLRPLGIFSCGLATALLAAVLFFTPARPATEHVYRFLIYQPQAHQVAVMGSFSHWRALEMTPVGQHGYWEISVALPPGEYRYSFLLDGRREVADPTRMVHEQDDFGGQNSILSVPSARHA
jgi:Glycogen recognition site of AMP-activated protein kinase